MTPEERIESHEQWLHSMESQQAQFAANLVVLERKQEAGQDQINQIAGILLRVAQRMEEIAEAQRKLQEAVDQYIRFRGDGKQTN
jgi:hypothetical protein